MATLRMCFLLLCLLFLGSCEKKPSSPPSSYRLLNLSFDSEIQSLDPRKGIDFPTFFVMKMLFEGLTHIGADGKVEPGIAKSCKISDDGKTYTFFYTHLFGQIKISSLPMTLNIVGNES